MLGGREKAIEVDIERCRETMRDKERDGERETYWERGIEKPR